MPERFVARTVVDASGIHGLSFVDLTQESIVMAPFERETPSTVFLDGVIFLLDGSKCIKMGYVDDTSKIESEKDFGNVEGVFRKIAATVRNNDLKELYQLALFAEVLADNSTPPAAVVVAAWPL